MAWRHTGRRTGRRTGRCCCRRPSSSSCRKTPQARERAMPAVPSFSLPLPPPPAAARPPASCRRRQSHRSVRPGPSCLPLFLPNPAPMTPRRRRLRRMQWLIALYPGAMRPGGAEKACTKRLPLVLRALMLRARPSVEERAGRGRGGAGCRTSVSTTGGCACVSVCACVCASVRTYVHVARMPMHACMMPG
jgi:hypothetical protein